MSVTLGQRVAFDKLYGKDLREKLKKIIEIKEEILQELDFASYQCDMACKTLSFFSGCPLDTVMNTDINDVQIIYYELLKTFTEEVDFAEKQEQLMSEIHWKDQEWVIAPPELGYESPMTFGEFLDAKQIVKNTWEFSQEKWECLLQLCCVYLRNKDEPYNATLIRENGQRYNLFKDLPFSYAMQVGFFLSSSLSSYISIFPFSKNPDSPEKERPIPENTWSSGDGSTFLKKSQKPKSSISHPAGKTQ